MSGAQHGRVTLGALALAMVLGVFAYGATKYLPLLRDHALLKAAVAEAGQRAVSLEDPAAARSWFDQQMRELGFDWLRSGTLYWQPVDRGHLDVGLRYEVVVDHGFAAQTLVFSWYCTASADACNEFRPDFD